MYKIYTKGYRTSGNEHSNTDHIEQFWTNGKLKRKTVKFTALFVIIVSEASTGGAQQKRQLACLPQHTTDPTETTKSKLSKIQTRRGKY